MAVIKITKGAHWRGEIQKAFESFQDNEAHMEILKQLKICCQNILFKAIGYRLELSNNGGGHDYTGNLINSIVVILYDDGAIADIYAPGKDAMIRRPKFRKMSARKKRYFYSNDYSGFSSTYRAEVPTNRGVADEDIEAFLNSNTPAVSKGFCITVAYTVEYATWVETERQTTGYLNTKNYALKSVRQSFKRIRQK